MNVELLPIAEKKIRQMGGEAMGVVVRRDDGILVAVTDSGRVTRLDDAVAGPVGDSAQGAEPVAKYSFYLGSGIRFFPLDAFEGLPKGTGYLYTQPAPKVPEGWRDALPSRKPYPEDKDASDDLWINGWNSYRIEAIQALSELAAPQQSGEWVRCEDRLPTEADGSVVWSYDEARETVELVSWAWIQGLAKNGHITHLSLIHI